MKPKQDAFVPKHISKLLTASSRFDLWAGFIRQQKIKVIAEIGVYRGCFSQFILKECQGIERYYMVDPWRQLDRWCKPANHDNLRFESIMSEALDRNIRYIEKIKVLRGTTTEVIEAIADDELDFAYIDGDHTLRGIAIDLVRVYPKIRVGGWLAGDDFASSIWQHPTSYEPTLVFPFAVYFAEAVGARIYALPHSQFLIEKQEVDKFEFFDLTGKYTDLSIKNHIGTAKIVLLNVLSFLPFSDAIFKVVRKFFQ